VNEWLINNMLGLEKNMDVFFLLDFMFFMDGYNATMKITKLLVIFNNNNNNILKLDVINFYVHLICGWELHVMV
jgi:hypothetical protein